MLNHHGLTRTRRSMYRTFPAAALEAYKRANERRAAAAPTPTPEVPAPPNRTPRTEPMENKTVSTATAVDRPKATAQQTPVRVPLKAFAGPDARKRAYTAWLDLRARVGRYLSRPDAVAEANMKAWGYDVRAIMATAAELNPAAGGYLTSPMNDAIIELKQRVGVAQQAAFVLPMRSETADIPLVDPNGGPTVYYVNETAAITPSDMDFQAVGLRVKKRAILSWASREVMDDAAISFMDLFIRQAAYGLAKKQDLEYIRGDGTSTYGLEVGLLGAIDPAGIIDAASGHDSFAEVDLDDFIAAMAALPEWAADGRQMWITSGVGFAYMMKAVGGASQGFDDQGRPLFLGFPVMITAAMPNTSGASAPLAIFGNFEQSSIIGERVPVSVTMSEHAGFENDTIALKATSRYDILVVASNGYVALQTAAS